MAELSHLDELEAEAIYIIREVAAECEKPVMLYSIGKDSSVMLHLAMKAFYPEKPPFPFLHVNTTWKFREMIKFRDETAKKLGIEMLEYINEDGVKRGINPFDHGAAYTDIMKTQALKGMRDLLPAEQTLRDYIQGKILGPCAWNPGKICAERECVYFGTLRRAVYFEGKTGGNVRWILISIISVLESQDLSVHLQRREKRWNISVRWGQM